MKVFVAGSTGVIGRALIPQLLAAGHDVVAMTRDTDGARRVAQAGATPAVADAFDANAVKREVTLARPDVIVSQLTSLPDRLNPRKLREYYAANDDTRRVGNENLLAAALGAGTPRFIVQSAGYWYAPEGGALKTEESPFYVDAPEPIGRAVRTMAHVEQRILHTPGIDGVALRYGTLYGPGTWYGGVGEIGERMRRRAYPIIGKGDYVTSFLHVEDAASATIAVIERGRGAFNVADDDPAPARVWMPEYASALGAKPPFRVPVLAARLAIGAPLTEWTLSQRGISSALLKSETAWTPRYASWREGFAGVREPREA